MPNKLSVSVYDLCASFQSRRLITRVFLRIRGFFWGNVPTVPVPRETAIGESVRLEGVVDHTCIHFFGSFGLVVTLACVRMAGAKPSVMHEKLDGHPSTPTPVTCLTALQSSFLKLQTNGLWF